MGKAVGNGERAWLARGAVPPRLSRRALLLGGGAGVLVAGERAVRRRADRQPTAEERARASFVRDYLATTQAYHDIITRVSVRGRKLSVHTTLSPDGRAVARAIYDKLWIEVVVARPDVGLAYVIVLDRDGDYLDGGQA